MTAPTEPLLTTGDLWVLLIVLMVFLGALCLADLIDQLRRPTMVDEHDRPIVHACPLEGSSRLPCCGRMPLQLPAEERISSYGPLVTCDGGPR